VPPEAERDGTQDARGPAPVTMDGRGAGPHLVEAQQTRPGAAPWRRTVPVLPGQLAPGSVVSFVGRNPRHVYAVSAGGQVCNTPCALGLPPGPTEVYVNGKGERFRQRLEIPGGAATVYVQHFTRRRVIAGGILMAVSVPFGLGGALIPATAGEAGPGSRDDQLGHYLSVTISSSVLLAGAGAFLLTGVGVLASCRKNHMKVQPMSVGLAPLPGGGLGALTLSW
jgi:hypothetical protein